MPDGKPAGMRCAQLLPDYRCALFGKPERPAVCASLRPTEQMCGASQDAALVYLTALEASTRPVEFLQPSSIFGLAGEPGATN